MLPATAGQVLASSGSGDVVSHLWVVLLFGGFAFYSYVYMRYRNTNKRYHHESQTPASLHHVRGRDDHIRTVRKVSNRRTPHANNHAVAGSRRSRQGMDAMMGRFQRKVRRAIR